MKQIYLVAICIASFLGLQNVSAQSANWEVGMRFGDKISVDATVPLGISPRLHPAVYFDRFGMAGYFDWMFNVSDGADNVSGLKVYPGVGPEFWFENRFDFAVAGNFGVEYGFDFPLTVGFDWRPSLRLTNGVDMGAGNWGFTARFRIGQGVSFSKSK